MSLVDLASHMYRDGRGPIASLDQQRMTPIRFQEGTTTMEPNDRVTRLYPPFTTNGQSREMAKRADADAARQRREAQFIMPMPVSRSSYLNEKDKHHRGVETVENAGDIMQRAGNRVLCMGQQIREAEADGASQQEMEILKGLQRVYGQGSAMLIMGYMDSE
jgi:hypothetical protein